MLGRKCTICAITFPDQSAFHACPACGEATWPASNIRPDRDWAQKLALKKAELAEADDAQLTFADEPERSYRYHQMRAAGLSPLEAFQLEERSDIHHEVEKLIARGCPPALAAEILR